MYSHNTTMTYNLSKLFEFQFTIAYVERITEKAL